MLAKSLSFISGRDLSTITRSMFLALRDQIDPTIAAISTIMIIISSAALVIAQVFGKSSDAETGGAGPVGEGD